LFFIATALLAACSLSSASSNDSPTVPPGSDAGGADAGPGARGSSDGGSNADAHADPCAGATGFVIDQALALSQTSLKPGDTLRGTVTYPREWAV
jgi:hypothetical protein